VSTHSPFVFAAIGDDLREAALVYARSGLPVFLLRPGGKEPVIPKCPDAKGLSGEQLAEHARKCSRDGHGFYDATTDDRTITRWEDRWPNANIGVPTGRRSGFWALDVDVPLGFKSLAALEEEHGGLPKTATTRSGGGGLQHWFAYLDSLNIRNSNDRLGTDLDVRGEGGYVVVPPSCTTGRYEFLERHPIAPAPLWLVEAATGPSGGSRGQTRGAIIGPAPAPGVSSPIPERQRNNSLFSLGCSLRARGYDHVAIGQALHEANALRCSLPLDNTEMEKITASACRYAPGKPPPAPEVLEALDDFEAWIRSRTWSGRKGPTRWKLLNAIVAHGRQYGEMIPGGVLVNISERQLAERAGGSRDTVRKHLKERLGGVIRLDRHDRAPHEAGAVVLPPPPAAANVPGGTDSKLGHLTTDTPGADNQRWLGGPGSSQLTSLRTSVAGLKRLGPRAGQVLEALLRAGGELHKGALAKAVAMRTSNLTRKDGVLQRLVEAEIAERDGDLVRVLPRWLEALEAARQRGTEDEAGKVQRTRHALQRAQWAHRSNPPNDIAQKALARAESAHSEAQLAYRAARGSVRNLRSEREDAG
jgi:hypothetical protein